MRNFICCGLLLTCSMAGAQTFSVPQEFWLKPRSGEAVPAQAFLRQPMQDYLSAPDAVLRVHHGKGEDDVAQSEELRAWLISLAVDSGRIELVDDSQPDQPITIEMKKRNDDQGTLQLR